MLPAKICTRTDHSSLSPPARLLHSFCAVQFERSHVHYIYYKNGTTAASCLVVPGIGRPMLLTDSLKLHNPREVRWPVMMTVGIIHTGSFRDVIGSSGPQPFSSGVGAPER